MMGLKPARFSLANSESVAMHCHFLHANQCTQKSRRFRGQSMTQSATLVLLTSSSSSPETLMYVSQVCKGARKCNRTEVHAEKNGVSAAIPLMIWGMGKRKVRPCSPSARSDISSARKRIPPRTAAASAAGSAFPGRTWLDVLSPFGAYKALTSSRVSKVVFPNLTPILVLAM